MRTINIYTSIIFSALLIAGLAVFTISTSNASEHASMKDAQVVELESVNDSGVTGVVKLSPEGEKTKVWVKLDGASADVSHPIHIHEGSCDKLGAPKFPLNPVKNGKSTTTVDSRLNDLISGSFAINAHKSKKDIQTYIACGEITGK